MTGICAGHKDKAQLGDVIVADPAWDFQSGKLKFDGKKLKWSLALTKYKYLIFFVAAWNR